MENGIPPQTTQGTGQTGPAQNAEVADAFEQAVIAGAISVGTLLLGDNVKELSKELEE